MRKFIGFIIVAALALGLTGAVYCDDPVRLKLEDANSARIAAVKDSEYKINMLDEVGDELDFWGILLGKIMGTANVAAFFRTTKIAYTSYIVTAVEGPTYDVIVGYVPNYEGGRWLAGLKLKTQPFFGWTESFATKFNPGVVFCGDRVGFVVEYEWRD